jgi:DNA polymerase-3 subunit gamma/tau
MSYQVLARKWRPRVFREMVGQEHVLQALINALDHNRLHHAYLFTGTRGVGKTTIARILAKCLNCETGVSSEPCGQCASCREIAEGRFVDLIEVDAASRTKVEDTRELLENVQYAPTRGRYKVYLIDEVHMLSNSSFNALLKTLEEPPPHVKFLLATTDPQKLPMTILSRCLQFNLKNMNPERIVQHLKFVLNEELVPFEESALWHLGRAADGSMRDAMSLTDQAIAYGSGKITEAEVSTMLGTIDQTAVYDIVTALVSLDGRAVLAAVERMSEQAPDYASALAEMLAVLHRIAIAQALPEAVDNSHGDRERIMQLAQQLPSEDVQLFYQTALLGRRDLPLAPDPRAGFEMVLLRMLAFKPQGVIEVPTQSLPQSVAPVKPVAAAPVGERVADRVVDQNVDQIVAQTAAPIQSQPAAPIPANPPAAEPVANNPPPVAAPPVQSQPQVQQAPITPEPPPYESYSGGLDDDYAPAEDEYEPAPAYYEAPVTEVNDPKKSEAAQPPAIVTAAIPVVETAPAIETVAPKALRKVPYEQAGPADWTEIYLGLGVTGILQSTVANCQLIGRQGSEFHFVLDKANSTLYDTSHEKRLADLLGDYFVEPVRVHIQMGETTAETPAQMAIRLREERLQDAISAIKNDPIVQQLIAQFGATLREETIQPI